MFSYENGQYNHVLPSFAVLYIDNVYGIRIVTASNQKPLQLVQKHVDNKRDWRLTQSQTFCHLFQHYLHINLFEDISRTNMCR